MAMTLRWHSCSKEDYPHRRHKVPQACHNCRTKKMRCDGKLPCDRCEGAKIKCGYSIKKPTNLAPKRNLGDLGNRNKTSSRQFVSDDDDDDVTIRTNYSKQQRPPTPQQQQRLKTFDPRQLKHLSFKQHHHYNGMQNSPPVSFFGMSQLPPLLFGFFSLTYQPYGVWTTFIHLLRQYNNSSLRYQQHQTAPPSPTLSAELSQEIMSLFGSHNYLYSAFMDMTQVISFLNSSSHNAFDLQNHDSSTTVGSEIHWVIINSIFALVFQAASQSLSHHCPDLCPLLQKQSSLFYQRAHHLFITITYPCFGHTLDSPEITDLTRASILLTHYQCVTISEEQAYMTLQMGLGYAHRLGLYDPNSTYSASGNNIKQMDCLKVLQKVLFGWQLWFSIYLNRSQPSSMLIPQDPSALLQKKSEVRTENYLGKKGNQRWTVDVLGVYIQFFMKILNATDDNSMTLLDIQHHLKQMESWSSTFYNTRLNFTDITTTNGSLHTTAQSPSKVRASQHLPAYVLSLYHQTLSIQLLQTQDPLLFPLLSSSSSSLHTVPTMPSPAPSSPRRDSGIGSHDGQSTLVSTPEGNSNHSLPSSPSSQSYSIDSHSTSAVNQSRLPQINKEGNNSMGDSDEIVSLHALTHAASIIMDTVDEIMVDGSLTDNASVVVCEKSECVHSVVIYPLYTVTSLLSALTFSAPPYSSDDVTQKRLLQYNVLDQHLSRLSSLLFATSSRLPITQYLLQYIQDMVTTWDTAPLGHHHGSTALTQKEQEKHLANEATKSLGGVGGLVSGPPYSVLHSSLPIRSALSPTPSSSSSSSTSVSTVPSISNFPSSAIQPPSTSTSTSSTSSLTVKSTTTINKLWETSLKPGINQERLMAIPTMDPSSRLVIDQQQLDKLSLSKGMASSFTPSYTTTHAETSTKRALDSTATSHQLNVDHSSSRISKKFKLTTTPEVGALDDLSGKMIPNHQLQYTQLQPQHTSQHQQQNQDQSQIQQQSQQHQQTYNDPFSTSTVMTTRYLDQLNGLPDHSALQQIYSADCLTDDNLWMAIVGNSSLTGPTLSTSTVNDVTTRPRRKLPMDGMNDTTNNSILTPKLPLPHIKHKNPTIAKTWQAAVAPINVDWNVCFSAEMNRTLHQNGSQQQQQPVSIDVATAAAAAAASLEQVDPSIHMNMSTSTSTNQENVLYLLSSNIQPSEEQHQNQNQSQHHQQQQQRQHQHHHHPPGDTNYFPTSSTWEGVDSSFF
ncbi:hypothetical protein BCR42DRAFT_494149 [Absidia repens]|uniref:Zn(2)-C6 fungal-type domain-containing protein n=1 Tax=Absidia repens TaxID=90262 RepID=A0A1X2I7K3_9FUNG|nr:hypothetical protein BCR42DRAFT_494149 [Absidia repens]